MVRWCGNGRRSGVPPSTPCPRSPGHPRRFAGGGEAPALDACNGHHGPVPANATLGVTAECAYHYHTTTGPPNLVGCYGPVASVAQCQALYNDPDGPGECLDETVDLLVADDS